MDAGKKRKTHKRQHYVPACYLRAWVDPTAPTGANATPYVWVFDRDGKDAQRRAPKNLFRESDIYTVPGEDGSRDLGIEHGLGELETRFAQIRANKLERKLELTADEHTWLCHFVAAAKFRTKASRDRQRTQWAHLRRAGEDLEQRMRAATVEQRVQAAKVLRPSGDGGSLTLDDVRQLEALPLQSLMQPMLDTNVPLLARMNATILTTSDPLGFLTTDCPCTWFDPGRYTVGGGPYAGPDLHSPTIEISLPLSPKQCLLLSHRPELWGYVEINADNLANLNRRHIAHCDKQVVGHTYRVRPEWFRREATQA